MAKKPTLASFFPPVGFSLLTVGGKDLVTRIGIEAVREVVFSVLCGENLRNETELLTRRRLAVTNGAMVMLYVKACQEVPDFLDRLPFLATEQLRKSGVSKAERWILNWLLGLTDKAVQNVVRDDPSAIKTYLESYQRAVSESVERLEKELGPLDGELEIGGASIDVDWRLMVSLLGAVGTQTSTIRGSEKSIYGKLFEPLILGSLLHILGFRLIDRTKPPAELERVFWLSERQEKRESDATAIFTPGKGIRFDIGFIGRGNSEISLDKVSRFEREMEFGRRQHVMATYIIVDHVGKKSRIFELAREIEGTVVQMSMSYWPKVVAKDLGTRIGLRHPLQDMDEADIPSFLERELKKVPIGTLLRMAPDVKVDDEDETSDDAE